VLDESRLDETVPPLNSHADVLERALAIISNGSFPPPGNRNALSDGQRRQLRDAMIFEAHVRHRRHALVTRDARGFINEGRRDRLELLGLTRIVTPTELETMADAGRLAELREPM
jgi:hypothetical protein